MCTITTLEGDIMSVLCFRLVPLPPSGPPKNVYPVMCHYIMYLQQTVHCKEIQQTSLEMTL